MDRNIKDDSTWDNTLAVALRKESVDRNLMVAVLPGVALTSLSARRAWIEITVSLILPLSGSRRSPQGERG